MGDGRLCFEGQLGCAAELTHGDVDCEQRNFIEDVEVSADMSLNGLEHGCKAAFMSRDRNRRRLSQMTWAIGTDRR